MNRRQFVTGTIAAGAGIAVSAAGVASSKDIDLNANSDLALNKKKHRDYPLIEGIIDSAPCLQNYAETSMGISFAVSTLANGYVKYSKVGDETNSKLVKCGGFRVTDMNENCMQVRLTGLEPSTTYQYVIGAWKIEYKSGSEMQILGYEEKGPYRFCTAGKLSDPHFCVINDTHENANNSLGYGLALIEELNPAFVLWNGDACNVEEDISQLIDLFLKPNVDTEGYAANRPYLFCAGNHDQRGRAARNLEKVWMFRQPEERLSRDWDLGRNFAVRVGQMAIIGLDTGEDKRDKNKIFAGIFNNEPYREAQKDWLEYALNLPDIKSAPFLIASCHIPLFDKNPRNNPGDVAPKSEQGLGDDWDLDKTRYDLDYTVWQRTCAQLWAPLLEQHNCQLVIAAHTHKCRYDAPTKNRLWGQIVGGGNAKKGSEGAKLGYPTVMDIKIKDSRLIVDVYNAHTNKLVDSLKFSKRNTN